VGYESGDWTLAIQPAPDEPGSKPGSGLYVVTWAPHQLQRRGSKLAWQNHY